MGIAYLFTVLVHDDLSSRRTSIGAEDYAILEQAPDDRGTSAGRLRQRETLALEECVPVLRLCENDWIPSTEWNTHLL